MFLEVGPDVSIGVGMVFAFLKAFVRGKGALRADVEGKGHGEGRKRSRQSHPRCGWPSYRSMRAEVDPYLKNLR